MATPRSDLGGKIQAYWRLLDVLVDGQSNGNKAILRALDIFDSASSAFKGSIGGSKQQEGVVDPSTVDSVPWEQTFVQHLPRGNSNSGTDHGRLSYFRAEEGLALAREQLMRNEERLNSMAEEVEGARRCIGSTYEIKDGADGRERVQTRASASHKVLDRGHLGCQLSPVEMVRIMGALLRMHQSEFEMQIAPLADSNLVQHLLMPSPTSLRELVSRPLPPEGITSRGVRRASVPSLLISVALSNCGGPVW